VVNLNGGAAAEVGGAAAETKVPEKWAKKPRKAAAGQKEMLMPIEGKKPAKEAAAKDSIEAAAGIHLPCQPYSQR
jgi:DNA end-binding protein Ku